MRHSRRDIGHRHGGVSLPAGYAAPKLALNGLSAAAKSALRAAWWTAPVVQGFASAAFDSTHLYDQSGAGRDLLSGAALGTAPEERGRNPVLVFDPGVPNFYSRADALGLAADPALTIAWKGTVNLTAGVSFPSLLAIDCDPAAPTPNSASLQLTFTKADSGAEESSLLCSNGDATAYAIFDMPSGTFAGKHTTFVLQKPAGTGFDRSWQLIVNESQVFMPDENSLLGPMALGANPTKLGKDTTGFATDYAGTLSGLLVFERMLTGLDLEIVQWLLRP